MRPGMIGIGVENLIPGFQVTDNWFNSKDPANYFGQFINRIGVVSAYIEYLVDGSRNRNTFCNGHRYVINITKGPCLCSIAKYGQWLALHDLVHKDPDHVPV